MRNVKSARITFEDNLQLLLDFGSNSGYVVHSEPFDFEDEKSKEEYQNELNRTIANIIRMLHCVS